MNPPVRSVSLFPRVARPLVWSGLLALPALAGGGPAGKAGSAALAEAVQDSVEAQPSGLRGALTSGEWWLKLRLRYEDVDQGGFDQDAHALTLRTVLGYETGAWHGFSALLEFEDVTPVGGDDTYDSTTNGETDRPVVADPDGTEINQAFLRYRQQEWLAARLGRQRITLDNQRFVGNVGWRQNEQTFDAAAADIGLPLDLQGFYAYVGNVNRVFGESSPVGDARMGSHLFHLQREFAGWGRLSLYDYYLDYDSADFAASSTNSLGARFAGKHGLGDDLAVTYALEYAHQSDVGDNPADVDADYWLGELGGELGIVTAGLGWELLGGDGEAAFQTPLATGHAFNGWADKFLTTPDDGLEDLYLQVGLKVSKGSLKAIYHDFQADQGSSSYGSELDLVFTWPLAQELTFGLKYADYRADDFATDTRKAWAWLETSL